MWLFSVIFEVVERIHSIDKISWRVIRRII